MNNIKREIDKELEDVRFNVEEFKVCLERAEKGTRPKVVMEPVASAFMGLDIAKLSDAGEIPMRGNYSALRHVTHYILCHMRRDIGRTALSLILAAIVPAASFCIDFAELEHLDRLLDSFFLIVVTASLIIGLLGPGLVIMRSAEEVVFLRVLGVTKKRAWFMLVFEQIVLCIAGTALAACGMALYSPGLFERSRGMFVACFVLYLIGCVCGASLAAVQVIKGRTLGLLQVKE